MFGPLSTSRNATHITKAEDSGAWAFVGTILAIAAIIALAYAMQKLKQRRAQRRGPYQRI